METVVLSFSGGRTSAYMTKYMLDNYKDKYNFIIQLWNGFRNSGLTLIKKASIGEFI